MEKSNVVTGFALAAAAATMFLAGAGVSVAADQTSSVKAMCVGGNACKGHGQCKSADNACKGQNACKGKSFDNMTLAECNAALGRK